MPYINELVAAADIAQYGLNALSQRYAFVITGLAWTVDHEQSSYLLEIGYNPEDPSMREFLFFWNQDLSSLLLQANTELKDDRRYLMHWHWLGAPAQFKLPEEAQRHEACMAALKDALMAYKSSGLSSPGHVTYVIDFDF
jgi:hypothetical protein